MAEMFLKLTGVDGESKAAGHENEIDVLAWSWGMTQPGSMGMGGGGGTGRVSIQDISITKYIDKASAQLMLFCCNGQHIDEGTLVCRKAAGGSALEFLKIKLTKVFVTSVSTGGTPGEEQLSENVTLSCAKFEVEYQEQQEDGSGQVAGNMAWNVKQNVAA